MAPPAPVSSMRDAPELFTRLSCATNSIGLKIIDGKIARGMSTTMFSKAYQFDIGVATM
jgi:hypothetical protein